MNNDLSLVLNADRDAYQSFLAQTEAINRDKYLRFEESKSVYSENATQVID